MPPGQQLQLKLARVKLPCQQYKAFSCQAGRRMQTNKVKCLIERRPKTKEEVLASVEEEKLMDGTSKILSHNLKRRFVTEDLDVVVGRSWGMCLSQHLNMTLELSHAQVTCMLLTGAMSPGTILLASLQSTTLVFAAPSSTMRLTFADDQWMLMTNFGTPMSHSIVASCEKRQKLLQCAIHDIYPEAVCLDILPAIDPEGNPL
ncbi:hypothetical protein P5673_005042 [Acropora cervicornis]|uniref:Uncharacterized protein n=1 Tax=Acropora cervicornis TaxID=6130 RepID=A0AAD9VDU2_ACRCE|nr:hypothetical protein P5673_005042 [Acropora cervicornis]